LVVRCGRWFTKACAPLDHEIVIEASESQEMAEESAVRVSKYQLIAGPPGELLPR